MFGSSQPNLFSNQPSSTNLFAGQLPNQPNLFQPQNTNQNINSAQGVNVGSGQGGG
jgi:hypothetical protein